MWASSDDTIPLQTYITQSSSLARSMSVPPSSYSSSGSSKLKLQLSGGRSSAGWEYSSQSKISSYLRFWRKLSGRQQRWLGGQWLGGGRRGSRASLRLCSTIMGIMRDSRGQLISRQGLALTSISQGFSLRSSMKSMPNISKLLTLLSLSRLLQLARIMSVAIYFIFLRESYLKLVFILGYVLSRYLCSSWYDNLLPAQYLPQLMEFFWMASLVRWTQGLLRSAREKGSLLVRTQPSEYQQALREPLLIVTNMQCLRSNFLPWQSMGSVMQDCTMVVLGCPFGWVSFFRSLRVTSAARSMVMPLPRLVHSPGFTIQMLRYEACFSFCRKSEQAQSLGVLKWQVLGMTVKGSIRFTLRQQCYMVQKRAFLEPMKEL